MRTLVVICHPKSASLTRAAADRVVTGLGRAGATVRILDLDKMDFDPVLTGEEVHDHFGSPENRPDLAEDPRFKTLPRRLAHIDAVYATLGEVLYERMRIQGKRRAKRTRTGYATDARPLRAFAEPPSVE